MLNVTEATVHLASDTVHQLVTGFTQQQHDSGNMQNGPASMHNNNPRVRRKGARTMGEAIGAIVFGLIGIAMLGAVLYIVGMLLTGPVILVDEAVKAIREHEHEPRLQHHGRLALHH